MYIYKLINPSPVAYDTYDSAIVVANSAMEAIGLHPNGEGQAVDEWVGSRFTLDEWVEPEKVLLKQVGVYNGDEVSAFVLCASYNAG